MGLNIFYNDWYKKNSEHECWKYGGKKWKIPRDFKMVYTYFSLKLSNVWLDLIALKACHLLGDKCPQKLTYYTCFFALFQGFKSILISSASPIYKFFTLLSATVEKIVPQKCSAWASLLSICTKSMYKPQRW